MRTETLQHNYALLKEALGCGDDDVRAAAGAGRLGQEGRQRQFRPGPPYTQHGASPDPTPPPPHPPGTRHHAGLPLTKYGSINPPPPPPHLRPPPQARAIMRGYPSALSLCQTGVASKIRELQVGGWRAGARLEGRLDGGAPSTLRPGPAPSGTAAAPPCEPTPAAKL
jgi:hypothetical protein